jgi:hypothetical protein
MIMMPYADADHRCRSGEQRSSGTPQATFAACRIMRWVSAPPLVKRLNLASYHRNWNPKH